MCEYMTVITDSKIPKCENGKECTLCLLGNMRTYKMLKERESAKESV